MPLNDLDSARIGQALQLARQSIGLSDPNPRVGCVIGRADGTVMGTGFTQRAGEAHAEVMALRELRQAGFNPRGATAWVTLEPCAHHGRTPPCCDALLQAGIGRVVVALEDPFDKVAGAGIRRLRAGGVEVVVLNRGPLHEAARDINVGFLSRVQRGRPWVRAKVAASLDGATALHNGRSQWITSPGARIDGHHWRKRAGAVVTGIGTVLADDPRLDVREVETILQPMRVVLDSALRTPPGARLFQSTSPVLIVGAADHLRRAPALRNAGAEVVLLPDPSGSGVDLAAVLRLLAQRGTNEVHLEAGATLNGALMQQGLIDEWLIYFGPMLLGIGARPVAVFGPLDRLQDGTHLDIKSCELIDGTMRVLARACSRFMPSPATTGTGA